MLSETIRACRLEFREVGSSQGLVAYVGPVRRGNNFPWLSTVFFDRAYDAKVALAPPSSIVLGVYLGIKRVSPVP